MTKAERTKMLRERFLAIGGFLYPKGNKLRQPRPIPNRKPGPLAPQAFSLPPYGCRYKWVGERDQMLRAVLVAPKRRRKGNSALQRIADRWDERKLIPKRVAGAQRCAKG